MSSNINLGYLVFVIKIAIKSLTDNPPASQPKDQNINIIPSQFCVPAN
jgi:hypothetical protein